MAKLSWTLPVAALLVAGLVVGMIFAPATCTAAGGSEQVVSVPTAIAAAPAGVGGSAAPAVETPREKVRQIRGFSMQLNDPAGFKKYIAAIDELAEMGCTSINFVIAARMDHVNAEAVKMKWQNLPSARDVERILKHAKSKGIYTILMPIVLLDKAGPKDWRGRIQPPDWNAWFDSYILYIVDIGATIAQRADVDLFVVGSELLSTEDQRAQWLRTIAAIKAKYKGKLTYSANWDHYDREDPTSTGGPTFWDQLDYIGMNNYHELADGPGASVAQLNQNWKPVKEKILAFVKKQNKPFLFTEVGWHNLENTIKEPWNYVAVGKIDLEEQKRAYQSFVEVWKDVGTDQFMGALVWEWTPGVDGAKAHGAYSLQGTPALEVVKTWMKSQGKPEARSPGN